MKILTQYLLDIDDTATMEKKLSALLTPSEISEMQHRLEIFEMLQQGIAQREIAKRLGVGIATVTRGSRAFKELKNNE